MASTIDEKDFLDPQFNCMIHMALLQLAKDPADHIERAMRGVAESKMVPDDKFATLRSIYELYRQFIHVNKEEHSPTLVELAIIGSICSAETDEHRITAIKAIVRVKYGLVNGDHIDQGFRWLNKNSIMSCFVGDKQLASSSSTTSTSSAT